jgi:hypothetical protein
MECETFGMGCPTRQVQDSKSNGRPRRADILDTAAGPMRKGYSVFMFDKPTRLGQWSQTHLYVRIFPDRPLVVTQKPTSTMRLWMTG